MAGFGSGSVDRGFEPGHRRPMPIWSRFNPAVSTGRSDTTTALGRDAVAVKQLLTRAVDEWTIVPQVRRLLRSGKHAS